MAMVLVSLAALLTIVVCTKLRSPATVQRGEHLLTGPDSSVFARYAGSESCRDCHAEEFNLWKPSNHSLAERLVRPDLDQPGFEPDRAFEHGTQTSSLRWTNNTAEIVAAGLSGPAESRVIVRVIGNSPLRQYLVPFPGGRFQALEAAWDPHANQWFNVYGNEDRKPGEWGHWTGRGMNWNYMCAGCHNTCLRRHYDEETDTYHTTMAEMSVGCEACHGPSKAHVQWQKQYAKTGKKDPNLQKQSRSQVMDTCGSCHSRRTELTGEFEPGQNFLDHFQPAMVDHSETFYADGQVHEEDYEYSSFISSRMHLRGVTCGDCHNPHSAKTILPGNQLCLRCHNGSDTNAPVINPVAHSRHPVFGFDAAGQPLNADLMTYRGAHMKETGGECVNCHMPQTVYMQRHRRHDHGFTIPDPLLTKELGIPNACNRCHQDKDADWALKHCDEWYGSKMNRPSRKRAQTIARARRGETQAREELVAWLKQEPSPYWQGVAVGLLQPWVARPEVASVLLQGAEHTNALVRTVVARSLEQAVALSVPGTRASLERSLQDPVRSVRLAAASSLPATLDPASAASRELQSYLNHNADQPSGQLQKAAYFFSRNELERALQHLQKAVGWDPYSTPLRQELAVVLSALNRPREALEHLQEACRLAPRDAECQFKLGLAFNEMGDLKNAAEHLAAAARLEPRHAATWYNLGLAQNSLGQPDSAIESLSHAETADSEDPRIPYARATILARAGRNKEAINAVRRALEINPSFTEAAELFQTLSN